MPRPFTLCQAAENAAFLDALRQTGNARLAARSIGRAPSTMHHRRAANAGFAQAWDAAAAAAHAAFHLAGGKRGPEAQARGGQGKGARRPARDERVKLGKTVLRQAQDERAAPGQARGERVVLRQPRDERVVLRQSRDERVALRQARDERVAAAALDPVPVRALRTGGGEPVVVRTRNGRLQLRLAHPDKLTKTAEQVFLLALAASANVRLAAAAAGASPAAFYRRRLRDPAFAREFRLALRMGWERLHCEALQAALPESHAHDEWRNVEPAALPPLDFGQTLQLLCLHRNSVLEGWDRPHMKKRRGETWETYTERLRAMWTVKQDREAEDEALQRAAQYESAGDWRFAEEAAPLPLPPLAQVTGWSKASGQTPHHEGVALFGGWRMADMERKRAGRRGGSTG